MKHALAVLLFCSAIAWSLPANPEYTVNVHVNASRMVLHGDNGAHYQNLSVVIDGKKVELESIPATNTLLVPGDYKARIVKDHHSNGDYDIWRIYEFQLPDKKTREFLVVGQSE
ncbi:MAG TPA: hypothetical protein VLL05_20785 [Terriglobales bacterium]|nr:hypothetical protein [Terriglobales bacterium]